MRNLNIVQLGKVPDRCSLAHAAELLENTAVMHPIDIINWVNYSYCPDTSFLIAHKSDEIWLKFNVSEKMIRAVESKINGEVYKDSCVELFISFDGINYYNLEFNCIGTIHMAYGAERHNRRFLPLDIIEKIGTLPSLGRKPFGEKKEHTNWELMITIPADCFVFDNINSLNGISATCNFYKCGDETETPHFVSWNRIGTSQPDFHRPDFFGNLHFQ